jgi:hypothetical protein
MSDWLRSSARLRCRIQQSREPSGKPVGFLLSRDPIISEDALQILNMTPEFCVWLRETQTHQYTKLLTRRAFRNQLSLMSFGTLTLFMAELSTCAAGLNRGSKKRRSGKINSAPFTPSQSKKTRLAIHHNWRRVLVLLCCATFESMAAAWCSYP